MRILALQFRNLNSLRGDHEIDFTAEPLRDAGIFAITGPTGAGKTTILDVITLALYGRAARYDRAQPTESMSRHTGECFAEVQFESRGRSYGARWELRRARGKADGALQAPKRIIYDLADKAVLVEKIKEVDAWVAKHTGLDYQRFLRSVLLAQGEFTAFLRASDKERGHLLEKLTGTEIYAELSMLAHEVTREKRQVFEELERDTKGLDILSDEEHLALEKVIVSKREAHKDLEQTIKHDRERLACLESWQDLERQRKVWTTDCKHLEEEERQAASWQARLQAHQRAEPYAALIAAGQANLERIKRIKRQAAELAHKHQIIDQDLKAAATTLQSKRNLAVKAATERSALQALLNRVYPLDAEAKSLQEQIDQITKSVASLSGKVNAITAKAAAKATELNTVEETIQQSELWIKEHRDDQALRERLPVWQREFDALTELSDQLGSLRTRQQQQQDQIQALGEQRKAHDVLIQDTAKQLSANETILHKLQEEREALLEGKLVSVWERIPRELGEQRMVYDRVLTKSEQFRNQAEQQSTRALQRQQDTETLKSKNQQRIELRALMGKLTVDIERRFKLIQRLQEIQDLRLALQDNDPCPVCGAKDHPTSLHPVCLPDEQERKRLEGELGEHRRSDDLLASEITRLDERIRQFKSDEDLYRRQVEALEEEVLELQENMVGVPFSCRDHEQVVTRLADLAKAQIQADQRLMRLRKIENDMVDAKDDRERLRSSMQQTQSTLAKLDGQLEAMKKQQAQLAEEQKDSQTRFDSSQAALATHLAIAKKDTDMRIGMQRCLSQLSANSQAFNERQQALQHHQQQRAQLQTEQRGLNEQHQQLFDQLRKSQQQQKSLQQRHAATVSQRQLLAGSRNLQDEWQAHQGQEQQAAALLESLVNVHANLREQLQANTALRENTIAEQKSLDEEQQAFKDALRNAASEGKFKNAEAMAEALLEADKASKLTADHEVLRKRRLQLQVTDTHLLRVSEELRVKAKHLEMNDLAESLTGLQKLKEQQGEAEQQAQVLLHDLWSGEKTLQDDTQRRKQRQDQADAIRKAQQEFQRWHQLNDLIGSADGSAFSRFAQGLTLARLVELANAHMARLTDRYGIQRHPERDLEIEIVDRYQANTIRSMQSLSGGESFLVSLALALGLSELAGREGSIDSLFIDEGFGSLDSDSLEVALRALENLQARHKTIGVISHTDLLKERVTCQIQVTRGKGGVSTLQVTQNAVG